MHTVIAPQTRHIGLHRVFCTALGVVALAAAATAAPMFQGLGDLPGGYFSSTAYGVSADGSVVVGRGYSASGFEAFRWTPADNMVSLGDLEGDGVQSLAFGVSADGTVVVGAGASASGFEAFRWTQAGGMVGLGDLPGGSFGSWANGVSADGTVVVGHSNSASGSEAFLWSAATGMQNLKTVLVNDYGLNLTGWTLTEAKGISADGKVIVGYGTNPSGQTEAWFANLRSDNIPEPGTLGLVTLGVLGLVRRRRRG